MEILKNRKRMLWCFFAICLAASFVMILISIFRGTYYTFHSDDATAVLLAREQIETGQLIPETWTYAYEYWVLSLNLLVIPFLLFIENWLLCRELAVIVQTILLIWALYTMLKQLVKKHWALLGCIMVLAPLSRLQMEHFYFQATYATTIAWSFFWYYLPSVSSGQKAKKL